MTTGALLPSGVGNLSKEACAASRKPAISSTDYPLLRMASMMPPSTRSEPRPSSMAEYNRRAASRVRLRAPIVPRPISLMIRAAGKGACASSIAADAVAALFDVSSVVSFFIATAYYEAPCRIHLCCRSRSFRSERQHDFFQFRHARSAIGATFELLLQTGQQCFRAGTMRILHG